MRCPEELIGRNSVTAWTSDSTTAWNGVTKLSRAGECAGRAEAEDGPAGPAPCRGGGAAGECVYFAPAKPPPTPRRRRPSGETQGGNPAPPPPGAPCQPAPPPPPPAP